MQIIYHHTCTEFNGAFSVRGAFWLRYLSAMLFGATLGQPTLPSGVKYSLRSPPGGRRPTAFRRRRHYVFGLSVRPSVRPKPEITSFDLYMGPLVHPTIRNHFTACPSVRPSVRPERFPGICRRMHGGIGLKFYMLMYLDHLQYWLVYGCGLSFFIILALFWLSETGQIWGFRAFPGKRMEEIAWNFARWCILTTFGTDKFMATVCWFF